MVFAMANPDPEVTPEEARPYARVIATGRSDYPNQINNVLCFPGIFRGALDVRAREITETMKMAAAEGIAAIVGDDELREDHVIPSVFNRDVAPAVADAVAREARRSGSAGGRRRPSSATRAATRRSSARSARDPRPYPGHACDDHRRDRPHRRADRRRAQAGAATTSRPCRAALRRRRAALGVEAVAWQPEHEPAPAAALAGRDAVVHLAGEDVAQRWDDDTKRRLLSSRELGTRNLVAGIRAAEPRPSALVSASAVGYYGPRGDEPVTEQAGPGDDFLAGVCVAWEREAAAAEELGVRVVRVRTGVVLDKGGGALQKMLPFFKLGVGGPVAGGRQWMPWIHVDDLVGHLSRRARRRRLERRVQRHGARAGHQQGFLQARSAARCAVRRSPRRQGSRCASCTARWPTSSCTGSGRSRSGRSRSATDSGIRRWTKR